MSYLTQINLECNLIAVEIKGRVFNTIYSELRLTYGDNTTEQNNFNYFSISANTHSNFVATTLCKVIEMFFLLTPS